LVQPHGQVDEIFLRGGYIDLTVHWCYYILLFRFQNLANAGAVVWTGRCLWLCGKYTLLKNIMWSLSS